MSAVSIMITRNKTSQVTTRATRGHHVELLPLPWPPAGADSLATRRPHRHRCVNCPNDYLCAGPDETGECMPLCCPCLWVELGVQLKMYQSMASEIDRRRRKIEERIGSAACRRAQILRRNLLRESNLIAGFGRVVLKHEETELKGESAN
jgi:hypothetical protein